MFYKLDGKKPVPTNDFGEIRDLFGDNNKRVVRRTTLKRGDKEITVSTVFLCIDHNYYGSGEPLLFETMIFGDYYDLEDCYRYRTWEEAEKEHVNIVKDMQEHFYELIEAQKRNNLKEEFTEITRFELMEWDE